MGRDATKGKSTLTANFFDEPEEASRVKADIVSSYFGAWARIMAGLSPVVRYLDLFAGPGRYANGESSTPLLILQQIVKQAKLTGCVQTLFNDADQRHSNALKRAIAQLDGTDRLKYEPIVTCQDVASGEPPGFVDGAAIPTLTFLDPWGYRGLTRELIGKLIRPFGCEVIFFFNYNRISPGIVNDLVEPHMAAIFTTARLTELRTDLPRLSPGLREGRIMRALGDSIQEIGRTAGGAEPMLVPFRFVRAGGRTSHYICFLTKHPRGYMIMKEVMASRGAVDQDGVPKFEYLPLHEGVQLQFDADRPLLALASDLLSAFAGQTLSFKQIVDRHNPGTPFITPNYRKVILELEREGRVTCESKLGTRRRGTVAPHVLVAFP